MALTVNHPLLKEVRVTAFLNDSSTTVPGYSVAPIRGKVVKIEIVYSAVVDSDRVLTTSIGSTAITGGAVTKAASGSAAGDISTLIPTAANACNEGDTLWIVTDGAGSTACPVHCVFTIQMA